MRALIREKQDRLDRMRAELDAKYKKEEVGEKEEEATGEGGGIAGLD